MPDDYMDIGKALEIVHELASQNALDGATCDPELIAEAHKQKLALDTVEDYIVNNFGD